MNKTNEKRNHHSVRGGSTREKQDGISKVVDYRACPCGSMSFERHWRSQAPSKHKRGRFRKSGTSTSESDEVDDAVDDEVDDDNF